MTPKPKRHPFVCSPDGVVHILGEPAPTNHWRPREPIISVCGIEFTPVPTLYDRSTAEIKECPMCLDLAEAARWSRRALDLPDE